MATDRRDLNTIFDKALKASSGSTLFNDAYSLFQQMHSNPDLDSNSAFWVMRKDAWQEILADFNRYIVLESPINGASGTRKLFDLPVRLTIGDDDEIPMIQLVMEPASQQRKGV